jgi:hypothetical protein
MKNIYKVLIHPEAVQYEDIEAESEEEALRIAEKEFEGNVGKIEIVK